MKRHALWYDWARPLYDCGFNSAFRQANLLFGGFMKFVITGATGHLGKLVVSRLLEQVPSSNIGVSVRDPEKAAALLEKGVRVRHGDFAAPESLLGAFDQAEKLLIVSPNVVGEKA
ncbi:MAG: hypothetical protein EOP05_14890, partial [Proteobacteria bacterium]